MNATDVLKASIIKLDSMFMDQLISYGLLTKSRRLSPSLTPPIGPFAGFLKGLQGSFPVTKDDERSISVPWVGYAPLPYELEPVPLTVEEPARSWTTKQVPVLALHLRTKEVVQTLLRSAAMTSVTKWRTTS